MNRRRIINICLFCLIGLLLVLQVKLFKVGGKHIQIADIQKLKNELVKEKAELEQIEELIFEYEEIIDNLSKSTDNPENVEEILKNRKDDFNLTSGFTDVRGEGVIIIITDSDRALLKNENPNNLIVHDVDIRNIIDDLRLAGAEAMSINGQRIIFNVTKIFCNGPTIKINDEVFAQPFIIKAIGNRNHLESAINAPEKYGNTLREWGIFVEVNTSINIEIPKYTGSYEKKYLLLDKGGE